MQHSVLNPEEDLLHICMKYILVIFNCILLLDLSKVTEKTSLQYLTRDYFTWETEVQKS